MPADHVAIHATAVAIAGRALLITGASGAGKSRLATALIAKTNRRCSIVLVGDDRVLLMRGGRVRPHPRIAGFIEQRGLGLVAMPWLHEAPVAGIATLDASDSLPSWLALPAPPLRLADVDPAERPAEVLAWWPERDMDVTPGDAMSRTDAIQS